MISSFPSCPIPEVSRLGRTRKQWKSAILAYFDTHGASNGPTETINGGVETTRRIADGFRNFTNYRLRFHRFPVESLAVQAVDAYVFNLLAIAQADETSYRSTCSVPRSVFRSCRTREIR
ncbi:hypothetical protein GCM10023063_37340 [Arthrobacter methylotrophus]|uniref:Transposase n=1 Tax=Arthrobacter methylotrophus TaxID=121291 RepID=A0ABV5UWB2_9MICC